MIYKQGDVVILKNNLDTSDWEIELAEEYRSISNPKIVTIETIFGSLVTNGYCYGIEGFSMKVVDGYVEGPYVEFQDPKELINTRFDILDL